MRWLVLSVLVSVSAFAGGEPILEVNAGAVGVAYVKKQTGEVLTLEIVFPASAVENPNGGWIERGETATKGPAHIRGRLLLFDGVGELGEVKDAKFSMHFWCENDGGQQWRPKATVKVSASALARRLAPVKATQSIAAFVVVAPPKGTPTLGAIGANKAALAGDLDGDGKPEAAIFTAPDEANNCDGQPKNNLSVTLQTSARSDDLRCCGP